MIPLVDLVAQYKTIKPEIDSAIQEVLSSGKFILGPNEKSFEIEVAKYLGVKHAIGVANGTDALIIALRAANVNPNDEVIVPAYSFFASASAVLLVGAKPVFVDINPASYLIDVEQIKSHITKKTKAIIAVHLYGQPADMDEIQDIANHYNLKVIEDNAQAFGAEYKGQKTGTIGDIGCQSFFPSKNLGGYGDGGMVTTNNDEIAENILMLRTHGWKRKYFPEILGYNSRLDELQAAILRVKLKYIDQWNSKRREIAHQYTEYLVKLGISTPIESSDRKHVYHLYIIRVHNREEFKERLLGLGIATEIYYPQPLHLAAPCQALGWKEGSLPISEQSSKETLALPLYPELTEEHISDLLKSVEHVIKNK